MAKQDKQLLLAVPEHVLQGKAQTVHVVGLLKKYPSAHTEQEVGVVERQVLHPIITLEQV